MTRLKSLRALYGYTQIDIAIFLGVTNSTYSLKENQKKQFTKNEIDKIIKFFRQKNPLLTYEDIFGVK